jgi:hypothetical protein
MEISHDKNVWFAGGYNLERSSAVISAIGFNKNLNIIKTIALIEYGLEACTVIKRMPHNDTLVVGGLKKILVINWTGSDFEIVKVLDNVHSSKFKTLVNMFRPFK